MVIFGLIGYLFKKFEYEGAPLVLALVLGPMMETALRRSLLLSAGDPMIFLNRPISAALMLVSIFLLAYPLVPWLRKKRAILPKEENED
jgi:putative tricarboxylic transport membrane protein